LLALYSYISIKNNNISRSKKFISVWCVLIKGAYVRPLRWKSFYSINITVMSTTIWFIHFEGFTPPHINIAEWISTIKYSKIIIAAYCPIHLDWLHFPFTIILICESHNRFSRWLILQKWLIAVSRLGNGTLLYLFCNKGKLTIYLTKLWWHKSLWGKYQILRSFDDLDSVFDIDHHFPTQEWSHNMSFNLGTWLK
jgi:hypothetical protein